MDGTPFPLNSLKVESRYGSVFVPETKDLITDFVTSYGEWGWDEVKFVSSVLQDGARVLDGGAFLGTFSLGIAKNKQLGFLCSVEANSYITPMLEANIRANVTAPAVVIDAMLAGGMTDPRPGHHNSSNLGSASFVADATAGGVLTPPAARAVTLPDLRREYGPFDLIKLDIEGMEEEVLQGDHDYLSQGNTTLWLECNEQPSSLRIAEVLLGWGLKLYYFAFPSHNPDNFFGRKEPIYPWAYEAGLLVAPAREPSLDAAMQAHGCILRPIGEAEDLRDALWQTPRWLPAEYAHANAVELAAAAGRALRGQSRESFLTATSAARPSGFDQRPDRETIARERLDAERQQRERAEAALAEAQAYVSQRDLELQAERDRREFAESKLSEAQTYVAHCSAELQAERERRESVESALTEAQAYVAQRTVEFQAECTRRERVEAALAEAQAECAQNAAETKLEAARCDSLERQLANATALALARLADLGRERERVEAALRSAQSADARSAAMASQLDAALGKVQSAEAQIAAMTSELRAVESRLAANETALVWRVVTPVHRFVGDHPGLHGGLRRLRSLVGAALRRRG